MAEVTIPDAASVEAAGAVMDSDFAGSDTGSLARTGAGAYRVIRDNDAATAAPSASNDDSEGYSVGSRWVDTVADEVYFCADASTGAAVWRQIGSGGGGGAVSSVFGRTGAVGAVANDYSAAQVSFAPDGDIAATTAQAAIVEVRDDADTKLAGKADSSALTAHTGDTANPHGTDIANLGTGTLAELNGRVTDATLDDAGAARAPTSHAATHAGGGADAIAVAVASGAAGLMSGADKAKLDGVVAGAEPNDVDSVHGRTGAVVAASGDYDAGQVDFTASGDIAATDVQAAIVEVRDDTDTKLAAKADTSTVTAHTSSTANPHSTDVGNLGSGTLAELNAAITDATLDTSTATRPPTAHASAHERGGADELDGDHLDIDFTPSNYTPSTTPAEAANVDDLAAHLAGIDDALGAAGGGGVPTISAISGMSSSEYYSSASGSGEINALGADFTVACLVAPQNDGTGFDRRYCCGTRDGAYGTTTGGGIGMGFLYGRNYGVFCTGVDGGGAHFGAEVTFTSGANAGIVTFLQQKWCLLVLVKSGGSCQFYINGSLVEEFFPAAGAVGAGGTWTVGATDQGSVGNGLDAGWVNGAGYVDSALTEAQLNTLLRDSVEDGQLADISGSWTRAHRVGALDPGATWAPFSGTGNLSETSTVDFEGAISNPQWR